MLAYLVTEVDTKEVDEGGTHVTSKDRILKQCKVRADDWADVVIVRVTCVPVTCMHQTQDSTRTVCSSANEVLQVIAKNAIRTRTRHRSQ